MKKRHSHRTARGGLYLSPTALRVTAGFFGAVALATVLVNLPDLRRYLKFETM
jgi:hypothetical protein